MDISTVRAFLKVYEYESFSIAAEKLFITQPAVSKKIKSLEQQLGCHLFDRIGKVISLTPAGKIFMSSATIIINEFENANENIKNLKSKVEGTIQISASNHIGIHYLATHIKNFISQHPKVDFKINFTSSEKAYEEVISMNSDIGFGTLPEFRIPTLSLVKLWTESLAIAVNKTHPLAEKASVELNELNYLKCLLPNRNSTTYNLIKSKFNSHHLPLSNTVHIDNLDTISSMTNAGLGWSVLPKHMIDSSELITLKVSRLNLNQELGAFRHNQKTLNQTAEAFLALVSANILT